MRARWATLGALLLSGAGSHAASHITIRTLDSLILAKGRYASILFQAESMSSTGVPARFTFRTSGDVPPGMVFESYPCHKPGLENCTALASVDGIYLDGTPRTAGTYRVRITATGSERNTGVSEFSLKVK